MMRLWMIFVPLFAVGALNASYDAWKSSPPSAQTELRRKCIGMASDTGITRSVAAEACNCAVNKARAWSSANPGAEYTLTVHRKMFLGCFDAAQAKRDNVLSQPGVFSNTQPKRKPAAVPGSGWAGAPPAKPDTPFDKPEDLGWGSD